MSKSETSICKCGAAIEADHQYVRYDDYAAAIAHNEYLLARLKKSDAQLAAIKADRKQRFENGEALKRYKECGAGEEQDPIERLRFFCSLAMSGQDWLDSEQFFEDLIADRQRGGEPVAWESKTPVFRKFVTDSTYQRFSTETKKWYKPYKCSSCEAPQPSEPDYKQLFEQMCERCDALDAKLAEYSEREPVNMHSDAETAARVGAWLSAALCDPAVCQEMKDDIRAWFKAGQPNVQPSEPVKCPDPSMGAHACNDKSQCWEPCGELGKSYEHAKVAEPVKVPSDVEIMAEFPARMRYEDDPRPIIKSVRAVLARYGQPVEPEGWQLVPKEPTHEMIRALWETITASHGTRYGGYKAMLEAAPKFGGGNDGSF